MLKCQMVFKRAGLFFALSLLCIFFAASVTATEPIFVDSRLLILAHPLFSAFDHSSGRFKGTSSEFVSGGQKGVDDLIAEIQRLNKWLLESSKNLQEKLKDVPLQDRMATEREFLRQKQDTERRVAILQRRAYNARLVPGRPGITPDASIIPQINELTADMRTVIQTLKNKYSSEVVIDVSELLPILSNRYSFNALLFANLHQKFLQDKSAVEEDKLLLWMAEADKYWARRLGINASAIPFGAKDVRLESIKLLETMTKGIKQ